MSDQKPASNPPASKEGREGREGKESRYKDTLNLPKTSFANGLGLVTDS